MTLDITLLARADVSKLLPHYDSSCEAEFAQLGAILVGDELGSSVLRQWYHPFRVNLPGGSYEPDFTFILADGRIVFVEVKGSSKQKGYRDARSKLRAAADLHPWATWLECRGSLRGKWVLEVIS